MKPLHKRMVGGFIWLFLENYVSLGEGMYHCACGGMPMHATNALEPEPASSEQLIVYPSAFLAMQELTGIP